MSQRNELHDLISDVYADKNHGHLSIKAADAVLAAGYRRPQQVTTVEELDALYEMDRNVVIADEFGNPFQNLMGGWRAPGIDHFWSTVDLHRKLGPEFTVLHVGGAE